MAESLEPTTFHDRVLEGEDEYKTITLEAHDGGELDNVEMHVVSKGEITQAIEQMPNEVFDAVDADAEDLSAEEAEEIAQEQGGAQVTEGMFDAFESLCEQSLSHSGLSNVQMELIIEEFAFEMVFELGSEVLTFSLENSGSIEGFREQS